MLRESGPRNDYTELCKAFTVLWYTLLGEQSLFTRSNSMIWYRTGFVYKIVRV